MKFIRHFIFVVCVALAAAINRIRGRALAFNILLTPHETSRGSQRMDADAGVVTTSFNAVVKIGSDDRHFALPNAAADLPVGILFNDQVDAGEQGLVPKNVALFGIFPETLPGTATAAIAAGAELVVDPANPGNVIALPGTTGTYYVFGRARYTVPAGGGPVSIIHCVPRKVVNP